MARTKKLSPEELGLLEREQSENRIQNDLERLRKDHYPKDPTIFFEVGEEVGFGNHAKTVITEVIDNGLFYRTHTEGYHDVYGKSTWYSQDNINSWVDLRKKQDFSDTPHFAVKDDVRLSYRQCDIFSLINQFYGAGVNSEPDYQRDYIWSLEDKVSLIDSIFNNCEIGKFLFKSYEISMSQIDKGYIYEIIDGKQRSRAILDFYEGRFKYKGLVFQELHPSDRGHFTNHNIVMGYVDNLDEQQTLKLFLKVNTTGRVMDPQHLEKIKKMIK